MNKKVKHGTLLTVIFTLLSLLYLYPIILVFINSFKKKVYIRQAPSLDPPFEWQQQRTYRPARRIHPASVLPA